MAAPVMSALKKGLVQQMLARPEPRLTTAQAAEKLGLSPTTIVRWANAGALPCIRTPGGHRRFPLSGLEAWEKRHSSGAVSPPEDDDDRHEGREEAARRPTRPPNPYP